MAALLCRMLPPPAASSQHADLAAQGHGNDQLLEAVEVRVHHVDRHLTASKWKWLRVAASSMRSEPRGPSR